MRTTIALSDELFAEARRLAGDQSFSRFASEAIRERVARLKAKALAREMEAGYRAEAEEPSLDLDWSSIEVEGL